MACVEFEAHAGRVPQVQEAAPLSWRGRAAVSAGPLTRRVWLCLPRRRRGGRAGGVPEVRTRGVPAGPQGEPWPRAGEWASLGAETRRRTSGSVWRGALQGLGAVVPEAASVGCPLLPPEVCPRVRVSCPKCRLLSGRRRQRCRRVQRWCGSGSAAEAAWPRSTPARASRGQAATGVSPEGGAAPSPLCHVRWQERGWGSSRSCGSESDSTAENLPPGSLFPCGGHRAQGVFHGPQVPASAPWPCAGGAPCWAGWALRPLSADSRPGPAGAARGRPPGRNPSGFGWLFCLMVQCRGGLGRLKRMHEVSL